MALADLKSKRFLTLSPVKERGMCDSSVHICTAVVAVTTDGFGGHSRFITVYYSQFVLYYSIKQALSKAVKTFPHNSTSDKGCKSHRGKRTSVLFGSYGWMRLKLFTGLIPYANMCEPRPGKVSQRFMEPLPEITSS